MSWNTILGYSPTADWILLIAFHSLWISLAAILIIRIRKFKAPAVRSTWCTFTIILLLIVPLITWFAPRTVVRTHPARVASVAMQSAATADAELPLLNSLMDVRAPLPQARINQWKDALNLFGFLWLAVTLVCLARLLYQLAFMKKCCNALQEIEDDRLSGIFQEIRSSFSFKNMPRFYVSPGLSSPISVGIRTPFVVLPVSLCQSLGGDELRAILLHELAHIRHYDHLLGLLQQFTKAVYWWNPFIYCLCRALSIAREEVCDNYAISGMKSAAGYATLLVSLIEKTSLASGLPCALGMANAYESLEKRIRNIVSRQRDMRVKTDKRMLSAISVTVVLLCGLVAVASHVKVFGAAQGSSSATSQAASPNRPSFEVASIKPGSASREGFGPPTETNDYFACKGRTLKWLLGIAYAVPDWKIDWQIKGGQPGWADSQLWDVEGRAKAEDIDAIPKPSDPRAQQARYHLLDLMLQSLLEDRFKLRVQQRTRQSRVYNLVVAKAGPKIKLDDDQSPPGRPNLGPPQSPGSRPELQRGVISVNSGSNTTIEGRAVTITTFIKILTPYTDRPINDRTNLKGLYNLKVNWSNEDTSLGGSTGSTSPLATTNFHFVLAFFTALQEQLGLRLESAKGPVEFLVIRDVQKPSGN